MREEDRQRFLQIKDKVIREGRLQAGIGTLSEKTLHAILKNYYEPDTDRQEIPIDSFVADIYTGSQIIEIQTGQFQRLREKLADFLPQYPVTVVYPVVAVKWLVWIDKETGEISERRRSPRKGNAYDAFAELYRIKSFLKDPNLKIRLVFLEAEEYKLLNGYGRNRKIRASKHDKVPTDLLDETLIERYEDYLQFVPYELEEPFTSKEFARAAHIQEDTAGLTLNLFQYLGVIERIGKRGRAYEYRVCL